MQNLTILALAIPNPTRGLKI